MVNMYFIEQDDEVLAMQKGMGGWHFSSVQLLLPHQARLPDWQVKPEAWRLHLYTG